MVQSDRRKTASINATTITVRNATAWPTVAMARITMAPLTLKRGTRYSDRFPGANSCVISAGTSSPGYFAVTDPSMTFIAGRKITGVGSSGVGGVAANESKLNQI